MYQRRDRDLLHYVLLALLAVGTVLRPIQMFACDLHAALQGHAGIVHDHSRDTDSGGASHPDSGHGPHDRVSLGDAAAPAVSYWVPPDPIARAVPSLPTAAAVPDRDPSEPFRPPIA